MDQQSNQPGPIRLLLFSASLREDSINTILLKSAVPVIEAHGGKVDFAMLREFDCPSFNQELEVDGFSPDGAREFKKRLESNDAFVIAAPEYNGSMSGVLKNIIDWVSRFRPQPFKQLHALLMSASPSMAGGNRGLWSLRIPLEHLGTRVYPDMFSLAMAHEAFNADGSFRNATLTKRFEDNLVAFMDQVEAAKHYPCIKNSWVEFLGEKPDPATERVE